MHQQAIGDLARNLGHQESHRGEDRESAPHPGGNRQGGETLLLGKGAQVPPLGVGRQRKSGPSLFPGTQRPFDRVVEEKELGRSLESAAAL